MRNFLDNTLVRSIAALCLIAPAGIASADDHLFEATQHGLSEDSQPFQPNAAGRTPEEVAGRGSPFTSFPENTAEQGVPSADPDVTASEHGEHELPTNAGPKN